MCSVRYKILWVHVMTLNEYLADTGITPAQAARETGIPPRALRQYRSGARRPGWTNLELLYRWSRGHVTPNDFLLSPPNQAA